MKTFSQFLSEAVNLNRFHTVVSQANQLLALANKLQDEDQFDHGKKYSWGTDLTKDEYTSHLADVHKNSYIKIMPAKQKYLPLDMAGHNGSGGSGKALVVLTDHLEAKGIKAGDIIGIKAYGVPHTGYRYGNVATVTPFELAQLFNSMIGRQFMLAASSKLHDTTAMTPGQLTLVRKGSSIIGHSDQDADVTDLGR